MSYLRAIATIMASASMANAAAVSLAQRSFDAPFSFCRDAQCADCPVSITSQGTGYPNCVTYNSGDVFTGQGFADSAGGGVKAYIDVNQPEPGCNVIIRSPAHVTMPGCGYIVGSFSHPVCAVLSLEDTFMVQSCCGFDQCKDAGATKRSFDSRDVLEGRGLQGFTFHRSDGSVIEPAETGYPPEWTDGLERRVDQECKEKSWVPDKGLEDYTRPADNTQIVATGVNGPGSVTITETRSQGWTHSAGMDFGVAQIFSLGMSISETFSEELSDGSNHLFNIAEGQSGDIGFTAFLRCTTGTADCGGRKQHGEVCTPYNENDNTLAGQYSLIIHN